MGTNGNKWHKKGESGRAWGYKCVIMVLSRNEGKAPIKCLLFLLCKKEKEYETTEAYCCWWEAKASRL